MDSIAIRIEGSQGIYNFDYFFAILLENELELFWLFDWLSLLQSPWLGEAYNDLCVLTKFSELVVIFKIPNKKAISISVAKRISVNASEVPDEFTNFCMKRN